MASRGKIKLLEVKAARAAVPHSWRRVTADNDSLNYDCTYRASVRCIVFVQIPIASNAKRIEIQGFI